METLVRFFLKNKLNWKKAAELCENGEFVKIEKICDYDKCGDIDETVCDAHHFFQNGQYNEQNCLTGNIVGVSFYRKSNF